MASFEGKLVLSRWMLKQFGTDKLEALSNTLSADQLIGFGVENRSKYAHEIITRTPEESRTVDDDRLQYNDDNIVRHWKQITEKRNHRDSAFRYCLLSITRTGIDISQTVLCCATILITSGSSSIGTCLSASRLNFFKKAVHSKLAVWITAGGGKTHTTHVIHRTNKRCQSRRVFDVEDEFTEKCAELIDVLEQRMNQHTDRARLFTIRWQVA